jgi:hypothetical protein
MSMRLVSVLVGRIRKPLGLGGKILPFRWNFGKELLLMRIFGKYSSLMNNCVVY